MTEQSPPALREAAQRLLAELNRKMGHRSDVMLHDYGPREDSIAPGVHRPDCSWCALEAALERPRPALAAALALGLTMDELAAALDDVLEKTTWEGKGKNIAPALLAALKSRSRPVLPAPEPPSGPTGTAIIAELIEAMRAYEMNVEEEPPYKHREMIRRAQAYLSVAAGADPIWDKLMLLLGDTWSPGHGDVAMKAINYSAIIQLVDQLRKSGAALPADELRRFAEGDTRPRTETYMTAGAALSAQTGNPPPEPSETAIEAAREASAHTGELSMADHLLSRRTTIGMLRAAYAVDCGVSSLRAPQSGPDNSRINPARASLRVLDQMLVSRMEAPWGRMTHAEFDAWATGARKWIANTQTCLEPERIERVAGSGAETPPQPEIPR